MGNATEHRKAPRVRVNVAAEVKGPRGFHSHARCMTLSPHGVELLVDWAMKVGAQYKLSIAITPQLLLNDVRAACVRCLKVGEHFRAALSFVNLDGPTFAMMIRLCGGEKR